MDQKDFIYECQKTFYANGMVCGDSEAQKLYQLTNRMIQVNKYMNLTAITDEKAIILRHYVDSLTISEHIPQGAKVIDIGCGAGFPSLPLAIFRPDISITSLDSTAKRIAYVAESAKMLNIDNIRAISARAEEAAHAPEFREAFDIATARAVASLAVLCELCIPFVKPQGTMIAMKSQRAADEIESAQNCIKICGGGDPSTLQKFLASDDLAAPEERNLIFIKKISNSPKIYPRHFSKISKKPL